MLSAPPVATCFPSATIATAFTGAGVSTEASSLASARFQTRKVLSCEPDTSCEPSAENATPVTGPEWPLSVLVILPDCQIIDFDLAGLFADCRLFAVGAGCNAASRAFESGQVELFAILRLSPKLNRAEAAGSEVLAVGTELEGLNRDRGRRRLVGCRCRSAKATDRSGGRARDGLVCGREKSGWHAPPRHIGHRERYQPRRLDSRRLAMAARRSGRRRIALPPSRLRQSKA